MAVLDPLEVRHFALERLKELPPDSDLDIHVALFNEGVFAGLPGKADKTAWLQEQVRPYIAAGYKITTELVPFQQLYKAVVATAEKHDVDFVVKPMRRHTLFQSVIRTSTDWNLIRHCPYPLLLVSELDSIKSKPIISAVDVCSGDDNHDELNNIVLDQAKLMARIIGTGPVSVNAWRTMTPMMAVGTLDPIPFPTPRDQEKEHLDAVRSLAEQHGLPLEHRYVEEGSPSFVINDVARRIGAGVIVMGTVARKGIKGALVGNTAEGVLEAASCDVMVVKLPAAT